MKFFNKKEGKNWNTFEIKKDIFLSEHGLKGNNLVECLVEMIMAQFDEPIKTSNWLINSKGAICFYSQIKGRKQIMAVIDHIDIYNSYVFKRKLCVRRFK